MTERGRARQSAVSVARPLAGSADPPPRWGALAEERSPGITQGDGENVIAGTRQEWLSRCTARRLGTRSGSACARSPRGKPARAGCLACLRSWSKPAGSMPCRASRSRSRRFEFTACTKCCCGNSSSVRSAVARRHFLGRGPRRFFHAPQHIHEHGLRIEVDLGRAVKRVTSMTG